MASFIGTRTEFKRYIGPRLRNLVNLLTKNHRLELALCNHCGSAERLESAHVRGRDRNQIIEKVLEQFTHNEVVTIDLAVFEQAFVDEHRPIEKTILILCRECHMKYDAPVFPIQMVTQVEDSIERRTSVVERQLLPIFQLPDPSTFKAGLMRTRRAEIITTYIDGKEEVKVWNAGNFTTSSNVIGNLRSRPEFRKGQWQARGITKVTVRVVG